MKPMSVHGRHFRWTLVILLTAQIVMVNEQTRNANFATLEFSIRYATLKLCTASPFRCKTFQLFCGLPGTISTKLYNMTTILCI